MPHGCLPMCSLLCPWLDPFAQEWVVMGTVDLDEFVDQALVEVPDWELNFKVLKAAARDAERLPNEVKVKQK